MYIHIHTYTLYIYTICTFSSSPFFLSPSCHFPSSAVVQESLCTSDEPYHNHINHLKGGTEEERRSKRNCQRRDGSACPGASGRDL